MPPCRAHPAPASRVAPILFLLFLVGPASAAGPRVQVPAGAAWAPLVRTIGLQTTFEEARYRVLVGDTESSRALGILPSPRTVRVAALVDSRAPDLDIFWEEPQEIPVYTLPPDATIFTHEKHTEAPLAAGLRTANGAVLWLAVDPGDKGIERYPFWLHALVDLGLQPPIRQVRTWIFYDPAYRLRVDPAFLAKRWRQAGVAGVHIAGWPFFDGDPQAADRLTALLKACRREGILSYCWLELPHISDAFWAERPACREKTATGQDAHLDWRKLIALTDPDCAAAVREGVGRLLKSFQWDGVNLGELYFESLYGASDPARFTPFHPSAREQSEAAIGFDPLELFDEASSRFWSRNEPVWRRFADWRAELALRLQQEWLGFLRQTLPAADLVVTQIDDRFEPNMRDLLGADAGALLALPEDDFTLLIEDPAPLWSLGAERYARIAEAYKPLTDDPGRLAIDLNIVERYQQTYPTRKQLGGEFLRLVDQAGRSFERVALYFESSISEADWELMPHIAAGARIVERTSDGSLIAEADKPFGIAWKGPALVNGEPWPLADRETVWLPRGRSEVTPAKLPPPGRILWLNAEPLSARIEGRAVLVDYRAEAPAPILLDRGPTRTLLDSQPFDADWQQTSTHWVGRLPPGRHELRLDF